MRKVRREDEATNRPREEESAARPRVEGGDEADTEGHMFLSDVNAAREIARSRNSEAERALRERRLEKEARPNRQGR